MAEFVQIIEFTTAQRDKMDALMDGWLAATEGKRTAGQAMICQDRDAENRYVEIVVFPSYEAAMKNNGLPETANFAKQAQELCDEMTFRNLDLMRTMEG